MPEAVDFDGIINEILTSGFLDRRKLEAELAKMNQIVRRLGSFEFMAAHERSQIIVEARRAVNLFMKHFKTIVRDDGLHMFREDFRRLSDALNDAGIIAKRLTEPDWAEYTRALMDAKFDALNYYMNRSVFTLEMRMTLFEMHGQKELQDQLVQFIAGNRRGMSRDELLDAAVKMIDEKWPAGYITLPTKWKDKDGVWRETTRKISTDYYADTWIRDVEATIHHTSVRTAYLQAGVDLVQVRSGEAKDCPICGTDVGKIFSLTGQDPDFRMMDFILPRHPHCDCYIVPVEQTGAVARPGWDRVEYVKVEK